MSASTYAVRAGVFAALTAGTALAALVGTRIFHDLAPGSAAYPFVAFAMQGSAEEQRTLGGGEAWVDYPWQVKAIAETRDAAEAAYDAAHVAMSAAGAVSATGLVVVATTRSVVFTMTETEPSDGTVLHHVGGVYHVMAREN